MAKSKKKVLMPASIRNKLLAAVAMLMVSSVMVVSSTYAWFTLSTAPEVKNISTTVAGNGSLEIALMPANGLLGSIKSGFSAAGSGGTVVLTTANTTWGNVINLSDPSYGLDKVELNPARLNEVNGTVGEKPLSTATYGYDGRIDQILANTALQAYKEGAFSDAKSYGVRAIGEIDDTGALGSTYGYVVDLAFRLNTTQNVNGVATPGKLLLQTEASQRIYEESGNEETLGGGSYMSFQANSTGINVNTLMSAIRVTFVQNYGLSTTDVTPTILGTAKLDVERAITGASETKAKLYLYNGTEKLEGNDAVLISALAKNAAAQVSAIVWLDGDLINNAAVQAVVVNDVLAQSTLNLQFCTDIELNPADNNVLLQGGVE